MMLDHLRHTLIPLSAGLLLVSCSSDEPVMSDCEMKFDISSVSRSAVTTASNITEKPFAIFGDVTPSQNDGDNSTPTIIYNNTPVTYVNSAWTTPGTRYWYQYHEHSFVAIHPASVLSTADADIKYTNSQLSFTYTVPSDYRQASDILFATHRRKYTFGATSAVYLRFCHIMSLINISPALDNNIMGRDDYIRFHKLELSGFKTKATFRGTPGSLYDTDQTYNAMLEVHAQDTEGNMIIELTEPVTVKNDRTHVSLFGDNDAVIMVPQMFLPSADARIIFYYTVNNDPAVKEISLPMTNQVLESGKSYNFRFTINQSGPLFEATEITDWEVADVGNIDIY